MAKIKKLKKKTKVEQHKELVHKLREVDKKKVEAPFGRIIRRTVSKNKKGYSRKGSDKPSLD